MSDWRIKAFEITLSVTRTAVGVATFILLMSGTAGDRGEGVPEAHPEVDHSICEENLVNEKEVSAENYRTEEKK